MWSMWNAPSDLDYYGQFAEQGDEEDQDICGCGARDWQACEEDCPDNLPAEEPAPRVPIGQLQVPQI